MLNQMPAPVDRAFAALADPTRLALIDRLARGPASVTQLAQPLPISLAAVMQHLRVLEAGGLITSSKAGRVRTCRIQPAALRAAERWIGDRRVMWEERLDRLAEFVERPSPERGTDKGTDQHKGERHD